MILPNPDRSCGPGCPGARAGLEVGTSFGLSLIWFGFGLGSASSGWLWLCLGVGLLFESDFGRV